MAALTFNKCCCCIDLRVGSLILGYINLVLNIIVIIMSLTAIVLINAGSKQALEEIRDEDKEAYSNAIVGINAIGIVVLIMLIINLAFAIVLLVGIHKNKPGHVKAYVIYNLIFIIISIIMFIVQVAGGALKGGDIVRSLLSIGFSTYILLVFRSYYYKMKEGKTNGAIYSA